MDNGALQRQMSELNNRSRWYSNQLWQVPFAYLTITGLAIVNSIGKSLNLQLVLFACAFFGACVFVHMCGIRDGERRAVESLMDVEKKLFGESTAMYKPQYSNPLIVAVGAATVMYLIAGLRVWICN